MFGIIIASSIAVYAVINAKDITYKNGKNVEEALNELYEKKNEAATIPYIEKIWQSNFESVNYTYNVTKSGKYLIGIRSTDGVHDQGSVTTTGDIVIEEELGDKWGNASLRLVDASTGDTINVTAYNRNSSYKGNAFICSLNNINMSEIVLSDSKNDAWASKTYTASNNKEKILLVAFGSSINKSASISYSGKHLIATYRDDGICIDYSTIEKDVTATANAYGYNWGGGAVFILK